MKLPHNLGRTNSSRLNLLLVIILTFLILTYLHSILRMFMIEKNFADFAWYYFLTQKLNEGINIFKLTKIELARLKQTATLPVYIAGEAVYSPFFHLMMTPFTHLSFWLSLIAWFLLNHLALVICLWFSALIIHQESHDRFVFLGILGVTYFASQPLLENMGLGQINVLILLALIFVCYSQQHDRRHFLAGTSLGFVLMLKPQYSGLILLYFFLRRNYAICISALAAYFVFRLGGIIAYGWHVEVTYWQHLLGFASYVSTSVNVTNLSLMGVINRLFFGLLSQSYHVVLYLAVSLTLCFLTYLFIFRGENRNFPVEYSSLICLSLLISPLMEEHHLVTIYLPILLAIYNVKHTRSSIVMFVLAFLLISVRYSLNVFSFFHTGIPALLTTGKTMGVFLLWYLFVWDMSKVEKAGEMKP